MFPAVVSSPDEGEVEGSVAVSSFSWLVFLAASASRALLSATISALMVAIIAGAKVN